MFYQAILAMLLITSIQPIPPGKLLLGDWVVTDFVEVSFENTRIETYGQKGDKVRVMPNKLVYMPIKGGRQEVEFKLDLIKNPYHIDLFDEDADGKPRKLLGIIDIQENELKLCYSTVYDNQRPDQFSIDAANFRVMIRMKRIQGEKK